MLVNDISRAHSNVNRQVSLPNYEDLQFNEHALSIEKIRQINEKQEVLPPYPGV